MFDDNNENILKNISIFSDIDGDDLKKIASEMKRKEFKAGDLVFKEGDLGDEFYVIVEGGSFYFYI